MDRTKIAQLASQLQNKQDLLNLLNLIKKAETEDMGGINKPFYPLTEKHLNFYCNPNHVFHRYRQFKIRKKTGGFRQITAPKTQTFMMLLSAVNEILRAVYTPSKYAMGFIEGRSVVSNASIHKGQNYVFNIDLKDFFPSIHQARVWKRLQLAPFNYPVSVANLIAGLCSMRETRLDDEGNKVFVYVLPQGAPTSPVITNMICDKLDHRLAGLAKRFGLHFSRYADDITFSSMHNVYQTGGAFRKELQRIITDQGFTINEAKTRLQKKGARQEVTGIIVSEKLNVTQKYVREIRNILYMWDRYGYNVAYSKFYPKYKEEKGHVKKGNPDLINVIDGKLMYLKMVKGENDSVYVSLYKKFRKLAELATDIRHTNSMGVTYLESTSVLEFEKKNSTEVNIVTEENGHRYAYFVIEGKKQLASVNKILTIEEAKDKKLLAISSCRDSVGKLFWLVHRQEKITVPPPPAVDLDVLLTDLDSLLKT